MALYCTANIVLHFTALYTTISTVLHSTIGNIISLESTALHNADLQVSSLHCTVCATIRTGTAVRKSTSSSESIEDKIKKG